MKNIIYADINGSHQNSCCAINERGEIIFAIEQERLSRVRFYNSLITEHCNNTVLIKHTQDFSDLLACLFTYMESLGYTVAHKDILSLIPEISAIDEEYFPVPSHHMAHAASAFYPSGFKNAAVITADAVGYPEDTTVLWKAQGTQIEKISSITLPHSLGRFYALIGSYLGLDPNSEGKVMGLSSYGKSSHYIDIFQDILQLGDHGTFSLNETFIYTPANGDHGQIYQPRFTDAFYELAGQPRSQDHAIEQRHEDIAFAAQTVFENAMVHITKYLYSITETENLCAAGGVFLNCVANRKIVDNSGFKNFFFQPAANDSGLSLGYAFYWFHNYREKNIFPHLLSLLNRIVIHTNDALLKEKASKMGFDILNTINDNTDVKIVKTAGELHYNNKQYKKAYEYFTAALQLEHITEFDRYDCILKAAYCCMDLKETLHAASYFKQFIEYDPTADDVRKVYCYCLIELNNFDAAYIELKPYMNNADFANVCGSYYFYQEHYETALNYFEIAAFELQDSESFLNCARCAQTLKKYQRSLYFYKKAYELNNDSHEINNEINKLQEIIDETT